MKILITGSAGFIGFHMANRLIADGFEVVGMDNISNYYDVNLKLNRLKEAGIHLEGSDNPDTGQDPSLHPPINCFHSKKHSNYRFYLLDLKEKERVMNIFKEEQFDQVIHLAAQAGVRYSLENPWAYIDSNIIGTMSILEACRNHPVRHLLYASSSSVYGNLKNAPFSIDQFVDHPVSLYAATKKSNELMAYTYSNLYRIPTTGLRLFTVYGPWGRPDMAYFKFVKAILADQPIDVFNHGELWRDFTYVDDIVEGICRIIQSPVTSHQSPVTSHGSPENSTPYILFNIGNSTPVKLTDFIAILEKLLNKKAKLNFTDMQPGDVLMTHADVSPLEKEFNYRPGTNLEDGLRIFVDWYKDYYSISNL